MTSADEIKELLADSSKRIKLHDFVSDMTEELIHATSMEHFPTDTPWTNEEFQQRLVRYEEATIGLREATAIIAFWGEDYNRQTLVLHLVKIVGSLGHTSGSSGWTGLRWYPALLLLYSGGIAAVAGQKYKNLRDLLGEAVQHSHRSDERTPLAIAIVEGLSNLRDVFNRIPGLEKRRTARSDHLFGVLQENLKGLMLNEADYEHHFDRFEVFLALEHAHLSSRVGGARMWGPLGRFSWKFHQGDGGGPLGAVIQEAESEGENWAPINEGLFGGSLNRFREVAGAYSKSIAKLGWH